MRSTSSLLVFLAACACPPDKKVAIVPVPNPVETPATPTEPVKPAEASADDKLVAEATQFVAEMDKEMRTLIVAQSVADWTNQTDLTPEHEAAAAKALADLIAGQTKFVIAARKFEPVLAKLDQPTRRQIELLKFFNEDPLAPDPKVGEEMTKVSTEMTSLYAKGVCTTVKGKQQCKIVDDYSEILEKSHDPAQLLTAWKTWHDAIGREEKPLFGRYVTLANQGARDAGFANLASQWRGGFDMPEAAFTEDVDRLWGQVKPLYEQLHCYARRQLNKKYGDKVVPKTGPIPAHLFGNMWAQSWEYIYKDLEPYKGVSPIDVTPELAKKYQPTKDDPAAGAKGMLKIGEGFYTSLGMDPLPDTFWQRSMFLQPTPPHQAMCHASAWDVTYSDDLRIKMCIKPKQEDLFVIHHELGHDYYFQHYYTLPILFQQGANVGFHEAIGDTIQLSVTPAYLHDRGLLAKVDNDDKAMLNAQMKVALEKIAFLPFGLLVDKWRWDVFSGSVTPDQYNQHWWDLRRQYQGVAPPLPRSADEFDPGAKYHVATNTSYMRYFLAHILQFQFHRALCRKAGFTGPLHECSIYGNKAAGEAYAKMLSLGASKPWQDALETLTGQREMDASALLEYFAPLQKWLEEQNKGQQCGW